MSGVVLPPRLEGAQKAGELVAVEHRGQVSGLVGPGNTGPVEGMLDHRPLVGSSSTIEVL